MFAFGMCYVCMCSVHCARSILIHKINGSTQHAIQLFNLEIFMNGVESELFGKYFSSQSVATESPKGERLKSVFQ